MSTCFIMGNTEGENINRQKEMFERITEFTKWKKIFSVHKTIEKAKQN